MWEVLSPSDKKTFPCPGSQITVSLSHWTYFPCLPLRGWFCLCWPLPREHGQQPGRNGSGLRESFPETAENWWGHFSSATNHLCLQHFVVFRWVLSPVRKYTQDRFIYLKWMCASFLNNVVGWSCTNVILSPFSITGFREGKQKGNAWKWDKIKIQSEE